MQSFSRIVDAESEAILFYDHGKLTISRRQRSVQPKSQQAPTNRSKDAQATPVLLTCGEEVITKARGEGSCRR
jgi:hypothetical protein